MPNVFQTQFCPNPFWLVITNSPLQLVGASATAVPPSSKFLVFLRDRRRRSTPLPCGRGHACTPQDEHRRQKHRRAPLLRLPNTGPAPHWNFHHRRPGPRRTVLPTHNRVAGCLVSSGRVEQVIYRFAEMSTYGQLCKPKVE